MDHGSGRTGSTITAQARGVGACGVGNRLPRLLTGVLVCAIGCGTLWPASSMTSAATPTDSFACAAAQAKQLGYQLTPDRTRRDFEADKTMPLQVLGPDITEHSRRNVLAVAVSPVQSGQGSTLTVRAETISTQETRRGMTDVSVPASAAVRTDADTLLARCRNVAPNTSLPG